MASRRRWVATVASVLAGVALVAQPAGAHPPKPISPASALLLTGADGEPLESARLIDWRGGVLGTVGDMDAPGVWRNGVVRQLSELPWARANDMSETGVVVGRATLSSDIVPRATGFSWSNGVAALLPAVTNEAAATSVNERGQILGYEQVDVTRPRLAVAWQDGQRVPPPAGVTLQHVIPAFDPINNRGQALVGLLSAHLVHPAVWTIGGGVVDLEPLVGAGSQPLAINELGDVTGVSFPPDGSRVAWVIRRGQRIDLGSFGGTSTLPTAMNDLGQITGISEDATGNRLAFLWQNGRMAPLPALPSTGTDIDAQPRAINNWGQVVGSSNGSAVLWQRGRVLDLGASLDQEFTDASDINDRGQVAGVALDGNTFVGVRWRVSPIWGWLGR